MNHIRLTSSKDAGFETAMELYRDCFPFHEQRESESQAMIMADEDYHFTLIYDGHSFVGCILYWETADFIYVEHFFIAHGRRNRAYGSKTLQWLNKKGKTVILEIDPPADDLSKRRKGFYKRCGFIANSFVHVHPPYHPDTLGHELVVMSSPAPLSDREYQNFLHYLQTRVMADVPFPKRKNSRGSAEPL